MSTTPEFGTWYPPEVTPEIGQGILISGFEQGDREPDSDGEAFCYMLQHLMT